VAVTPRTLAELEPSAPRSCTSTTTSARTPRQLFGFLTRDERTTFQVLIATHGVGPALAMAILATHPPSALVDIVAERRRRRAHPRARRRQEDRRAPARRAQEPLSVPVLDPLPVGRAAVGGSAVADVREALAGLGYGPDEIRDVALRDLPGPTADAPVLLRDALKLLGARRA
jgi:holliday junction DNA helicase RuvA